MPAYLAPAFNQQFIHNGVVAAGYKLYTYSSGTATLKTVYTNQAGSIDHTNPITLDADGKVPGGFFLGTGEYTLSLYTDEISDGGALVKTWDDVSGDEAINAVTTLRDEITGDDVDEGPGMIPFDPSVNYVVGTIGARFVDDAVSIKSVILGISNGAKGGNVIDDTVAIQAAVDYAYSVKRSNYIPPDAAGYKHTQPIRIPGPGASMWGAGGDISQLIAHSCDGLHFTSGSYDRGSCFFEDFGLVGASGSSANWAAIVSTLPSGGVSGVDSRDGLHFRRLKLLDWNQGFIISDTWESTIENCKFQKVRNPITLGNYAMVWRIFNNFMVYEGGDSHGGTADAYGVKIMGPICEGAMIEGNQITGFARCVHVENAVYLTVNNNDLSATVIGMYMSTVNNGLDVIGNYFDMVGNGTIGFKAAGLATEIAGKNIVKFNTFIQSSGANTIGMEINDAGNTNSFHFDVCHNNFSGFDQFDIRAYNPGVSTFKSNKCKSTAVAYSMFIGTVAKAPVVLEDNYLAKGIQFASPSDIADGKIVMRCNVEYELFSPKQSTALPTTGTFVAGRGLDSIVWASAPTSAGFIGWVPLDGESGTMGTLNGGLTTGSINIGTTALTVNSTTGLSKGQYVAVAGAITSARVINIVGLVVTLDTPASANVAGAAVSYKNAVFKTWGAIS